MNRFIFLIFFVLTSCGGILSISETGEETVVDDNRINDDGHNKNSFDNGHDLNPNNPQDLSNNDNNDGDTDVVVNSDSDIPTGDTDTNPTDADGDGCDLPEDENPCDESHKILICHNNKKEICVDYHSEDAHLAKGDYLGRCQ